MLVAIQVQQMIQHCVTLRCLQSSITDRQSTYVGYYVGVTPELGDLWLDTECTGDDIMVINGKESKFHMRQQIVTMTMAY